LPHLILPHASAANQAGQAALATLKLPQLERLLARLQPGSRWGDDEYTLSAPHELVLAGLHGWSGGDGRWPWAAHLARQDGLDSHDDGVRGWGLVTPCHWLVGSDQVSLVNPAALELQADESQALLEALRPSFEAEGWELQWGAPLRWYARHTLLRDLATASLDRVIGRNLDLWLRGLAPEARRLRRLQVEAQMLWHDHPVNSAREARRDLSVNSFWLSGAGTPQAADALPAGTMVDDTLRTTLLADDWAGWCAAWQALDAGPIQDLLHALDRKEPVSLTLCGERQAQRYDSPSATGLAGRWQRWRSQWQTAPAQDVLAGL
jgi:hypothetical protein